MLANFLSFLRIPLAIAFIFSGPFTRLILTLIAAVSDALDGFFARRMGVTKLGTLLDPLGDKVFATLSFGTLYFEEALPLPLLLALFAREGALLLFFFTLWGQGKWAKYNISAFFFGKVMTTCQFLLLVGLLFDISAPKEAPLFFVALGIASYLNLLLFSQKQPTALESI